MKKESAIKKIYEYLATTSRPESLQGLTNISEQFKKAEVIKALERLVEEGKVIELNVGKTKIFYLDQKEVRKSIQEQPAELDRKIQERNEELKMIETRIKAKENELAVYDGKSTKRELNEEKSSLLKSIEEFEKQFKASEVTKASKENKAKAYDYEQVSKECRKRKRITQRIIDSLEEFESKPKKRILEDIGIEFYN